jgi:hypothetical protein
MTGGEPLMDKNTYRVFDYVLALPNPELHIDVTSNFSVEEALWEKYLGYTQKLCATNIEHFMQYVSLDSGDAAQAKYIRHGLDFWRVVRRTEEFLSKARDTWTRATATYGEAYEQLKKQRSVKALTDL